MLLQKYRWSGQFFLYSYSCRLLPFSKKIVAQVARQAQNGAVDKVQDKVAQMSGNLAMSAKKTPRRRQPAACIILFRFIAVAECQRQLENVDFRRNGMSFFAGQYTALTTTSLVGLKPVKP